MFPSTCSLRRRPVRLVCHLAALLLAWAAAPAVSHAQTASQFYREGVEAHNKGDAAGATRKLQLALQVDKNFRPASLLLTQMAQEQRQAAAPAAPGMSAKTLAATVVPVEFSNTTLTSALEYIRQKALETSGGKTAINFAVNLPPELANKKITLKMDHVPVMELLRYMGEQAGVSFERQQYAIVVTPAGVKPPAAPNGGSAPVPAS